MKTTIHLVLGSILLSACSSSPGDGGVTTSSTPAPSVLVPSADVARAKVASDVLFRVRDLVAGGRVNGIGFSSPADLDGATLGDAIPVYFVGGKDVLGRTPGADPHEVMGKPIEILYPVLVKGVVKSQVRLARDDSGNWAVLGVGAPEIIQSIDRTTKQLAASGHAAPVALVEMHDVGVNLLAHEETAGVMFTAFAERGAAGLPVGRPVPAEGAFARVAELARRSATALR